jgi:hypothetical protein
MQDFCLEWTVCLLILIFILLPRWHYSPMRTFASLMDFSQSALFFELFPVFNFAFVNVCKDSTYCLFVHEAALIHRSSFA